jgi:hypothetical protein
MTPFPRVRVFNHNIGPYPDRKERVTRHLDGQIPNPAWPTITPIVSHESANGSGFT